MPVFARPATWAYDLELFRAAVVDEDELEALMAAIARDDQQLLVAESDERPTAFAWLSIDGEALEVHRFHVDNGADSEPLARCLLERIAADHGGTMRPLVLSSKGMSGIEADALRRLGFVRDDSCWYKTFE